MGDSKSKSRNLSRTELLRPRSMEYVQLKFCGFERGKLGDVMTPSRSENEVLPQSAHYRHEHQSQLHEQAIGQKIECTMWVAMQRLAMGWHSNPIPVPKMSKIINLLSQQMFYQSGHIIRGGDVILHNNYVLRSFRLKKEYTDDNTKWRRRIRVAAPTPPFGGIISRQRDICMCLFQYNYVTMFRIKRTCAQFDCNVLMLYNSDVKCFTGTRPGRLRPQKDISS